MRSCESGHIVRSRARILPDTGFGSAVRGMLMERGVALMSQIAGKPTDMVHVMVENFPECLMQGSTKAADIHFDSLGMSEELAKKVKAMASKANGAIECSVRKSSEHGVLGKVEMDFVVVGDRILLVQLPKEIEQIFVRQAA